MNTSFELSYPVMIVDWDGQCIRRRPVADIRRQLDTLRAVGVSWIMVAGFQYEEKADFDFLQAASELGDLFEGEGFRISSHHCLTANCAPLDQSQDAVREKLALNVEFGARMKVNTLVTHPEWIEGRHETFESVVKLFEREEARHGQDAVIDAMASNFREMGRLAEAAGVNVAIENLGRFGPLGDLQTLPKLVNRIDHPAIGYCLDSGHAHAAGESVTEWIRTMGGKLFTTHFHDNRSLLMRTNNTARFVGAHDGGDEHMSPGFGTIPWIDVIQALRKLPYARPLNFETGGWPFVEGAESYRLAIAWWRTCEQLATKKGRV